jgi:hypothetical protein
VEEETAMDLSAQSPAERALFKTEVMPAAVEPSDAGRRGLRRQQLANEGEESPRSAVVGKAQPSMLDPAEYARRG